MPAKISRFRRLDFTARSSPLQSTWSGARNEAGVTIDRKFQGRAQSLAMARQFGPIRRIARLRGLRAERRGKRSSRHETSPTIPPFGASARALRAVVDSGCVRASAGLCLRSGRDGSLLRVSGRVSGQQLPGRSGWRGKPWRRRSLRVLPDRWRRRDACSALRSRDQHRVRQAPVAQARERHACPTGVHDKHRPARSPVSPQLTAPQ